MSIPLSMIDVHNSIWNFLSTNSAITFSSCPSPIWPWATPMLTSGTSSRKNRSIERIDWTRLWTKKICPPRWISRRIASDLRRVELDHEGSDCPAVLRRGRHDAHVAQPGHRHVEGPGNRGRGERENIYLGSQLFQFLLVLHAEALLFVDHQKPKVFEGDVGAQELMGANQDIDLTFAGSAQGISHLLRFSHSRDDLDTHWIVSEAISKGVEVLLSQDRGRHQYCHLLMVERSFEGRAHRHFCLPVADVAANQSVHRFRFRHVVKDLLDRLGLIRRFFELELSFELMEVLIRGLETVARMGLPSRVDLKKLGGHLEQVFLDPLLGFFPGAGAELVERHLTRISAGELLDQPHPADRQIDFVASGVLEDQEVSGHALNLHLGQPGIATDPEIGMDDQVPFFQLAEGGGEGKVGAFLASSAPGPHPEDFLVGDDRESAR